MSNRWQAAMWAGFGSTLAIALISYSQKLVPDWSLLFAPFGATAVLLFAVPDSPLAHPVNVILGHSLTALIGLCFVMFVGVTPWSIAIATGFAVSAMVLTNTVHPPAGANPIVILLSQPEWDFIVTPVLVGALCLVALSWLVQYLKTTILNKS